MPYLIDVDTEEWPQYQAVAVFNAPGTRARKVSELNQAGKHESLPTFAEAD